jgi:uncharacterized surface protein with fasciclin (FAS1) repeats
MRITNPIRVNHLLKATWLGILALLALTQSACNRTDPATPTPTPTPPAATISQVVVDDARFSLLEAAVIRAGLTNTLAAAGPLTVFAPTDAAFQAAGFADAAAVSAAPVATLNNILLYHVISGTALSATAIPTAQTAYPSSLSNAALYTTQATSGSVSVNNARVTAANVQASNGIIHVIDRVLMPPTGNILTVVAADTSLSLLAAAAQRGGTLVTGALTGTSPLTVFAPTNAAFRAAGFANVAAINAAPEATLTAVLTNHVVAGTRGYSPTLINGATLTSVGNGSLTVTLGSSTSVGVTSRGNSGTASQVTTPDINATNGVIHKINRVLLP